MKRMLSTIIIITLPVITGCRKFVSIDPPIDQAQTSLIFNNDQAAISATVGLYSQMMVSSAAIGNGGATYYQSLSADELFNTTVGPDYDGFRYNEIELHTLGHTRLWTLGYRYIYHINSVLQGVSQSSVLTDTLKNQLRGEMLVMRAYLYYYLVNMYGDIPLITETNYDINQSKPRTPVDSVIAQAEKDLLEAKVLLPPQYASSGRVRANKWSATAMLARISLYQQEWEAASQYATEVINTGTYVLSSNLNNVFLPTSTEAIWQLMPSSNNLNTSEGNQFNPSTSTTRPNFALTSWLLGAFEPNDQRKTNWTKTVTVAGQPYTHPYKYKVRTGGAPYAEHYTYLRLAEQYLIRAEARAQLNDIAGSQQDLNKIRNRAGLANTTANTKTLLLTAIEQERRIEFMFEWGHRWIDLKRTGRAHTVLAPLKAPGWQITDLLYPIPLNEIESNPFLVQNPGY